MEKKKAIESSNRNMLSIKLGWMSYKKICWPNDPQKLTSQNQKAKKWIYTTYSRFFMMVVWEWKAIAFIKSFMIVIKVVLGFFSYPNSQ